MTIAERNNKLKHFITCLKCEVSGKCCDDNCPTQYDAGTMGEIIENLEAISKALEQEPTTKNDLADAEMIRLVRESDVIDRTDGSVLAKAFNYLFDKYIENPTTKNDLAQERYQDLMEYFNDKEVAKTILEDRKEFKAWLERLRWNVNRVDELARELEQLKETTKNDLGVDAISRIETIDYLCKHCPDDGECFEDCDEIKHLRQMPSVTPQEQRWIPVSERLPKKDMACLVAVGKFNFTQIAVYSDLMGIIDHRIFYQGDVGHNSFKNITKYVKAWMPLPKPYEPQESEDKG